MNTRIINLLLELNKSKKIYKCNNQEKIAYKKLSDTFSKEQLQLFLEYDYQTGCNLTEDVNYYFEEGFKLGVKIAFECLKE